MYTRLEKGYSLEQFGDWAFEIFVIKERKGRNLIFLSFLYFWKVNYWDHLCDNLEVIA